MDRQGLLRCGTSERPRPVPPRRAGSTCCRGCRIGMWSTSAAIVPVTRTMATAKTYRTPRARRAAENCRTSARPGRCRRSDRDHGFDLMDEEVRAASPIAVVRALVIQKTAVISGNFGGRVTPDSCLEHLPMGPGPEPTLSSPWLPAADDGRSRQSSGFGRRSSRTLSVHGRCSDFNVRDPRSVSSLDRHAFFGCLGGETWTGRRWSRLRWRRASP